MMALLAFLGIYSVGVWPILIYVVTTLSKEIIYILFVAMVLSLSCYKVLTTIYLFDMFYSMSPFAPLDLYLGNCR